MNFNMSEAKIPDFEDMLALAQKIKEASLERTRLELLIEDGVAKTVKILTTNPEYHNNGKPPSMAFINATYVFSGINGELYEYRVKLGTTIAELEFLKNKLVVYRDMIDVWRTFSANQRASVI
jgi:hypothetical protein